MTQPSLSDVTIAFDDVRRRIESVGFRSDPILKEELLTLYRTVDSAINEWIAMKDTMREFTEGWKARHVSTIDTPLSQQGARSIDGGIGLHVSGNAGTMASAYHDRLGASTFIEKAWSKISFGEYLAAEQLLVRALELVPTDIETRALLGWAQMFQDKLDSALMHSHDVLSCEPTNALARINVGYICLKKGIFGEAIEHLSNALRQDTDARAKLYATYYLGLVYVEREMYDDAQGFFERAIALGPNLVEAYFALGHACWLSGNVAQAIDTWERGSKLNKHNPWSSRCQEMLADVCNETVPLRGRISAPSSG